MPDNLSHLFARNTAWAVKCTEVDPQFFSRLSSQQAPQYLWIGCSDSRVPANEIVDMDPGELFVHRNIANVVVHTDLNCLSVIQYAVDVLKVKHIIVCGHYGCGGVIAAYENRRMGLSDNWIRHIQDVRNKHAVLLESIATPVAAQNLLCEINVIEQVINVCQTTIVQDAWARGQDLTVHSWIYGLRDGRLHDLGVVVSDAASVETSVMSALDRIAAS
jgi:carbonic anhydrase